MKIGGAAILVLLVIGVVAYRQHDSAGAGGTADAERVRDCLQDAGKPAMVETSSTGQRQVAIADGPVQVSEHVTVQNSRTYISFLQSADEAAWWADQLRQATDIPDDSVVNSGNAFVQYGAGATPADRAAVASCLS